MSYLSLKIFKRGQLIQTKLCTDDQISIGSSEGLSLQLEELSPWHLLIEEKNNVFCILDLNSEQGTKLNGQTLTEEALISSGDKISAGPYEIQFFIGAPKKTVATESLSHDLSSPEASISTEPPMPKVEVPSILDKTVSKVETPPTFVKTTIERTAKPRKKGFWNTYATPSKNKNLDEFLSPSIGNLIEVVVCWQERILSSYHFFKSGDILMGTGKKCQIKFPNMLGQDSYRLLNIFSGATVYLNHKLRGTLFQGKDKSTRDSYKLKGDQALILKPYEMIKLDFNNSLKVYISLMQKPPKIPLAGLLNLKLSEALALFLAFVLTGCLIFYGSLYAVDFLRDDINFIEKDIRVIKVTFKKPPQKIVDYQLNDETQKAKIMKTRLKLKQKKSVTKIIKKIPKPKPKPKPKLKPKPKPKLKPKKKRVIVSKNKKQAKMLTQAPSKKKLKKKKSLGSIRPGGSLKTGKKAISSKTVAPDPNKVGLLGAFGGGGKLSQLDKGATGSGGLLGLAQDATGFSGTKETYKEEGIGTKTKDLGSGGQRSSIVGFSNFKTTSKGLGQVVKGAGGLGARGRMNIEFGTEDINVLGQIDRGAILQTLKRNTSKFQRCYQISLNEQPSIQGQLGMEWLISSNGRGRSARAISNPMESNSLAQCVAKVLEKLNFPEPPSGQIPKVTFDFKFYL